MKLEIGLSLHKIVLYLNTIRVGFCLLYPFGVSELLGLYSIKYIICVQKKFFFHVIACNYNILFQKYECLINSIKYS